MGDDDKKAAAMFREVENRLVWLAAFLVRTVGGVRPTKDNARFADEALDEYQTRFPAIPADGPKV